MTELMAQRDDGFPRISSRHFGPHVRKLIEEDKLKSYEVFTDDNNPFKLKKREMFKAFYKREFTVLDFYKPIIAFVK